MARPGLDRPLTGTRIVALEQAVSLPFCTFMLAELGADVIKIERPGTGDVIRGWDEAAGGLSSGFVWVNANKRDLAVDASTPEGLAIVRALVAGADAFVENLAPGAAARLGLGPDELMRADPRLIYASLSGYGQDGPYRDVKAYDLLVQGESGILLTNGTPDEPAKIGLPAVDLMAGSNAALGITSALLQRAVTSEGCYLDVAMLDAALPWLGYFPHRWWHAGEEPPRTGMRHQYLCPYGPYLASDRRYVNIVVASDSDWARFCGVVDRVGWLTDDRFASISARRDHRAEVEPAIETEIAKHPSDYWATRLAGAGLPYGEVRTVGEVASHPQALHRELFVEASSSVGPLPLVRFPLADPARERHIPDLGEHTFDILAQELGYDPGRIAALAASGVVATGRSTGSHGGP